MRAHELLVGGDDMLARTHRRAEIGVSRFQTAHHFDHDADGGIAHDLVKIRGDGARELRTRTAGEHGGNTQVCSSLGETVKIRADRAES